MKKVLAMIVMLVMVIGLVPFSVSAEAPLGSENYQKALEGTNLDGWQLATQYYTGTNRMMPMAGAHFDSNGLTLDPPKYIEKGHSSLVTWDMIDISKGGSVTIKINEFPDFDVTDDAWISFSLVTEPVAAQGSNNQQGMVAMLRGYRDNDGDGNADVPPTALINLSMPSNNPPFLGIGFINFAGEGVDERSAIDIAKPGTEVTFEWGMDTDGQYRFAFNDFSTTDRRANPEGWTDAAFKRLPAQFKNHMAYLIITVYSASRAPLSFTITDFDGHKPSGDISVEPEVFTQPGPEILPNDPPPGQPGLLWDPTTCTSNPDIDYANVTITEDGWHIVATGPQPVMIFRSANIGLKTVNAEFFPIIALKVRRVARLIDTDLPRISFNCRGIIGHNHEVPPEGIRGIDEWNLIVIDISDYIANGVWRGLVDNVRIVLGEDYINEEGRYRDLTGNGYELAWVGFFRTEKDAIAYYEGPAPDPGPDTGDETGTPPTTDVTPPTGGVETTPATDDVETPVTGEDNKPATGEEEESGNVTGTETEAPSETTKGGEEQKKEGGFPVWAIILIVVVVLAGGGCALFFLLKKKKTS